MRLFCPHHHINAEAPRKPLSVGGEAQLPDVLQNLPKCWLGGTAHGSICIQEGQPSFADDPGARRGRRGLTLQLETQFCADTIITARNLPAEAPARPPDRAVACKAAPRRCRCSVGVAYLPAPRTASDWI